MQTTNGVTVMIDFDYDWKFFAITPAINLNFHSGSLEIEWLFFAIYAKYYKHES